MKILGIDTTTKFLCLAIYNNGIISELNLELGLRHSSLLTVMIKRALDALGLQCGDIDYFACGVGPGSFTGIRVGLSAIKGLAWALGKPVIGVSTLDILARNACGTEASCIIPAIDAKRSLIYCSVFKAKGETLKRTAPYMLLTQEEFVKKIKNGSILLGDALGLYKEKIMGYALGVTLLDRDYWYPKGHHIIPLALEKIQEQRLSCAADIKPIYLYPKECQIKIQ